MQLCLLTTDDTRRPPVKGFLVQATRHLLGIGPQYALWTEAYADHAAAYAAWTRWHRTGTEGGCRVIPVPHEAGETP